MPGLPNGPFLEKTVKCPEWIRGRFSPVFTEYARYAVFRIWVSFHFSGYGWPDGAGPTRKARQTAIRCLRTHYMHLNLSVFRQKGHGRGPVCRRKSGFTTVRESGDIPYDMRVRPGIFFRNSSGQQRFSRIFSGHDFFFENPGNPVEIQKTFRKFPDPDF
jgi:hypothetical protein